MTEKKVPIRKMTLRPLGDRIMVRQEPDRDKMTPGGIALPDAMKERSKRGKVLAVGKGKVRENGVRVPPDVQEGDTVIYGAYAGTEVDPADKTLVSLTEYDIIAVIVMEEE